jgi:transposase
MLAGGAKVERLHMNYLRDLIYRLRAGESERRIAADLGISRPTVAKYHALAERQGYLGVDASLPDDAALQAALGGPPQPPRQPSSVEAYGATVAQLLEQGCEMTAIYARLREDYGYRGSYSAVRRYIHQQRPAEPRVTMRVHSAPGEEVQVDFGAVGQLYDPRQGRPRLAYVFVATLCYSRHQYAELVFDQKIATWIGLHRRAFAFWGGVPHRIVPDNLKAAVSQALIYDPVLGEAYRRMAQHYGCLISPTRPATPQHKGKVESGVHYVQRNFMAGQQFTDIDMANARLKTWVCEQAGARNHGTTHQAPLKLFTAYEQAALLPLPAQPFTLLAIRAVKVHPDCHVVIEGSYYSAPCRYVGQTLEAYIGERVVQLFSGQELLCSHERATQPGEHHTRAEHYPPEMAAYLQRTPDYCRRLAAEIGPATQQVVQTLLDDRPLDRLRSVQALLRLEQSVTARRLEAACARALFYGDVTYRRIKQILNAALDCQPLPEQDVPLAPATLPAHPYVFARHTAEFFVPNGVAEAEAGT